VSETVEEMAWTKLATLAELPPGSLIEVERNGVFYALCNVAGDHRALGGTCPHQGGPLGEGVLNGEIITCPWHMWEFHSATGACAFNESVRVPSYPVRIEGSEILVDLA
jgi:nitrite reductase (NADH) small subunit